MLRKVREVHNWTPREFCEEVTLPQIACLWLEGEALGRRPVELAEAIELLKKKGARAPAG